MSDIKAARAVAVTCAHSCADLNVATRRYAGRNIPIMCVKFTCHHPDSSGSPRRCLLLSGRNCRRYQPWTGPEAIRPPIEMD